MGSRLLAGRHDYDRNLVAGSEASLLTSCLGAGTRTPTPHVTGCRVQVASCMHTASDVFVILKAVRPTRVAVTKERCR